MPRGNPVAEGYIEVKDRLTAFYTKHPEGSIQSEIVEFVLREDGTGYCVVKAWAYRSPNDVSPGIGHSSMMIPGATPFTRGSELENTETSAWGRALASLGFEVNKSIASADEISNKSGNTDYTQNLKQNGRPANEDRPATPAQLRKIHAQANSIGVTGEQLALLRTAFTNKKSSNEFSMADVDVILSVLDSKESVDKALTEAYMTDNDEQSVTA